MHRGCLRRRNPAVEEIGVAARSGLVGRHHEQLAQTRRILPGRKPAVAPAVGSQGADPGEGFAQQVFGKAGAQSGEQGRAGRLDRPGRGQSMRAGWQPVLVQPACLAVHGAEQDGQYRALGQGLRTRVAHHRPARCGQIHFARLDPWAGTIGQPQDRAAVGALQRAGQQQSEPSGIQQRQQRPAPTGCKVGLGRVGEGIGRHVGQRGQVMHFVQDQERAVSAELRQMQVGRGGDGLIGGDVALQAAARVGRVVGGADRNGVTKGTAPGWVGESLFCLLAQAVARHHPAHALDDVRCHKTLSSDDGQQRLATTGRNGGEDVGNVRRLATSNGVHDRGDLGLVGAERAGR